MKKLIFVVAFMVSSIICLPANIGTFNDGLAIVRKSVSGQYGYSVIDLNGETVVPFYKYDWIGNYKNGRALCEKNDKYGYLNTDGKLIIPTKFDFATYFNGNYAFVREGDAENGKYHTIDKQGEIIYTFPNDTYFGTDDFYIQELAMDDGFVVFASQGEDQAGGNNWYLITHLGKIISDAIYDNPFRYDGYDGSQVSNERLSNENIIIVSQQSIYNDEGKEITPYGEGAINLNGTPIIPLTYSCVVPVGTTLSANKNLENSFDRNPDSWERFDLKGNKISLPPDYVLAPYIGDPTKDHFVAYSKKTKRMGILNKDGKEISDFKYFTITGPDKYGICMAYVGDIDEEKYDWFDPDRYSKNKVDLICLNDRSKDQKDLSIYSEYADGILITKQGDKYYVKDIVNNEILYTLENWPFYFSRVNNDITITPEKNPQTKKEELHMRNRKGQIIYTIQDP